MRKSPVRLQDSSNKKEGKEMASRTSKAKSKKDEKKNR